jgi:hypothetical protein
MPCKFLPRQISHIFSQAEQEILSLAKYLFAKTYTHTQIKRTRQQYCFCFILQQIAATSAVLTSVVDTKDFYSDSDPQFFSDSDTDSD